MTTFIIKLIVAVAPLTILVGCTALYSLRRKTKTHHRLIMRRTCRSIQKALAQVVIAR